LAEPAPAPPVPAGRRVEEAHRIGVAAAFVESTLRARARGASDEARAILEATAMFAADPALLREAADVVGRDGEHAERAVWSTVTRYAERLAAQGGRAAERVADLHDLRDRIVSELLGRSAPGVPERDRPFVLVAHDLAPADTSLLDPALCLALVTEEGGPTSHTAIIARALGIPAIVATEGALDIAEGTTVLVDGTAGRLVIDPGPELLADLAAEPGIAPFVGKGQTADGHRVELLANVASPDSVGDATGAAAEGVGLFRTEFCFLDRDQAPSIAEQVAAYRTVLAAFPGRKVIFRTLDSGADKPLAFVTAAHEVNPALGIRGYRTTRRRPELLDDQLRAIALAAEGEGADVGVMAPMIDTVEEAADFARRCAERGLKRVGVMIETPAAAMTASEILEVVDFVSIGTNDLAQYTMAADRLVGDLAALNDPWQPAVLRLVALVGNVGVAAGKPVGVCGEAAADALLATVLAGLEVSSLSMAPRSITAVADRLGRVSFAQCVEAAQLALAARSAVEARAAVAGFLGA
jgi:phosphotransferase system enzyme I (PtsI)